MGGKITAILELMGKLSIDEFWDNIRVILETTGKLENK